MLREKILLNNNDNLNVREFKIKKFEMPWHSHPEYELVYIISGSGKKFVGEAMAYFTSHDLTMIGPNIPHFFLAEDKYYAENNFYCHWWVIQFSKEIFPPIMDELEAFKPISNLLALSNYGIHFTSSETKNLYLKITRNMINETGLDRITSLYHLLNYLSKDQTMNVLCEKQAIPDLQSDNDFINRIYRYMLNNFKNEIRIEDLAKLVNMQVTTLCSYYKRYTLKTIVGTLLEIRISHACKLIVNTRLNINQIAYECGFGNISNFNRQFLKLKKVTPGTYRSLFNERL